MTIHIAASTASAICWWESTSTITSIPSTIVFPGGIPPSRALIVLFMSFIYVVRYLRTIVVCRLVCRTYIRWVHRTFCSTVKSFSLSVEILPEQCSNAWSALPIFHFVSHVTRYLFKDHRSRISTLDIRETLIVFAFSHTKLLGTWLLTVVYYLEVVFNSSY